MLKKNIVYVILLLSFTLAIAIRWNGVSGDNYRSIINSDGRGYYHYYEAMLGKTLMLEQQANGTFLVKTPDGKVVNKYFVGLPILWSPFVMPVYFYHRLLDNREVDLYSEGFQKAVSLAALFYLLLGLIALKKLFESFNLEPKVIGFSLFAFFFGTNLSYYTIIAPSMSHVYSFALIAAFLYFVRVFSTKEKPKYILYASIILGFIILIRPLNGLILFAIPIVWKSDVLFIKLIRNNITTIAISSLLVLLVLFIQTFFWNLQTGSLLQWSYTGEGFYFNNPQILKFVFSFRKGFLIYTPIIGFSIISLGLIFHRNKKRAIFSLGFILLLIYVLSSWWNWYYGDSYGSRVMIDYLPVFILLFALGLQYANVKVRLWIVIISMLLITFNIFQSYQYYHNIMSHFDMNGEKYSFIFLKSGENYENKIGGNDDIAPYHREPMELVYDIYGTPCHGKGYSVVCRGESTITIDGEKIDCVIVDKDPYVCGFIIDADSLLKYRGLYTELQNSTYSDEELNDVFWTVSLSDENGKFHYYAFRINGIPVKDGEWRTDIYRFPIPTPKDSNTKIQISIWNKGERSFIIKDIRIKLYGIVH